MQFFKGFTVFMVICATFAQDLNEEKTPEGRDLREYNQELREIDSPLPDPSGWIPHFAEIEDQPLKRRRIRKRKRRPPVLEDGETLTPRRRPRPQRLDQIKEPWEDVTEENQKSNNRRRLIPVYDETQEINEPKIYERVRDPFTALQEAEEKQKKQVEENKALDLKTLLKQSGGLRLSEVLQEKNLTLSELLKGNRQAISVIAKETETTTESVTSTEKYRRIPPSVVFKKERNFVRDRLSSQEVMEAQRKRLALLHSHKEIKMFPGVVQVDVVTEETTEKRIFVPSSYKSSTQSTEEKETTTTSTTTPTVATPRNLRQRKLPMTSAKLNKLTNRSSPETSKLPVSIGLNEIFGIGDSPKNKTEFDEPLKMIIDLSEVSTTSGPEIQKDLEPRTTSPVKTVEESTLATTVSEKLKHVTAKEEIMEILNNPQEREQLSKILSTRNMTVEELVAQRERGSSQLHLADIFHNKTREPEPKEEPFIGHIRVDNFEDVPFFNRKSKTIPIVPEAATTQSSKEKLTTKLPYTITSFPTYKIETNKDAKIQPFLPIWQQLYPHFFQGDYEGNHQPNNPGSVRIATTTTEKIGFEELERVEEIENALAEAARGGFKIDLQENLYEDDDEFIKLPSGVKSAILASLAIIGLSLLVFLTILLIFKWSQKKKRRLNYNGSFLGSKIRSPILEPDQRRTFRTFVSETLGKRKNYYKAHVQSMSDSIWDKDEKKSYMT